MAAKQVTLFFDTSDDCQDNHNARNDDLLSAMFDAMALEFTRESPWARYLIQLAKVHRGRAEASMAKPKEKVKKLKRVK